MIWEQPPQGISVAPTDRLKRALEEGDTRRRESLARHEAWSRARAQWHLRVSMAEARRICTSCGQDLGDE